MRDDTLNAIFQYKVIAIVRGLEPEKMKKLAEALLKGGVRLIEITFAQNKPETWNDTADGIRMLNETFGGDLFAGAGTVIAPSQLEMAREAGARYIISPNVDASIIAKTREMDMVSLPGAMTPSEVVNAYSAHADIVKVFPVGNLGSGYLKALKAPLSHIPIMAVGGVNEKNAEEFLHAGACGLGVGGNLVNKEWIANGEFNRITALAREFTHAVERGSSK